MSPRPRRITPQGDLQHAIKETAWKQIAEKGTAALALRAIARELHITAPAIYNYYADRDALVTALIVEAFTSFGDALEQAIADIPEAEVIQRLRTLGLAYRQWAITYPERYQLIFGTPIAGYSAPEEITHPAASRSLDNLIGLLADIQAAGRLRTPKAALTPELQRMAEGWTAGDFAQTSPEVVCLGLTIWGRVHGLVSLEVGNQYPPGISDPGAVYRWEIERMISENIV